MGTYDFDRFKDNGNVYLCKDSEGRQKIEAVRTETDNKLEAFRKSLQDRYVIIGDSYLEGYTPDGNVESFGHKLQRMMNKSDEDWVIAYKGGVGFINKVDNQDYYTLTEEAYNKCTSPETITHVIYAGGYNDSYNTSEAIQNAIVLCYTKMHSLFPNAVMYLANIACNFKNEEVLWHLHDNVLHAYNCSADDDRKICSLGYIGNCLHERGMMASDGYHPNDWGQRVIAVALSYKLRGGELQPVGRFIDFTSSYSQPGVSESTVLGKEFFNKDTLTLTISRIDFKIQPSIPTEQNWLVGKISDMHYVRSTYASMASIQTTGIICYNEVNFRTVSITIGVQEGGYIFVRLHTLNKEGTNYEILNNIKFIAFDNTTLRVPLCYI